MNCNKNCKTCRRTLISTSVEIGGLGEDKKVFITVPKQEFRNLERRCLIIAQCLPDGSNNLPVLLKCGRTIIPVLAKTGNTLRADQVRSRKRYPIIHGTDTLHFSLECGVPQTCYTFVNNSVQKDE